MSTYHYETSLAPGEIRILQVQPGSKGDPFACNLITVPLKSGIREQYIAISYAWESQPLTEQITIDGKIFFVTHTIFLALSYLRLKGQTRNFWIDAICISQEDDVEKSHQVAQLRHIFHGAERVIVWLGDSDEDTVRIMTSLNPSPSMDVHPDKTMEMLLWKPWWSRIWVLQEVLAGRELPIIKCGEEEITWDQLVSAEAEALIPETDASAFMYERSKDTSYENYMETTLHLGPTLRSRMFLDLVKRLRKHAGETLSWPEALTLRFIMEATDPRDLTYATVGLMSDNVQRLLQPDYTRDKESVFLQTAKAAIQTDYGLESLALGHCSFNSDLPSWLPDYGSRPKSMLMIHPEIFYRAAGSSLREVRFSEDGASLFIAGVIFDTVADVADDKNNLDISEQRKIAYKCGAKHGFSDEQVREQLWRTSIMNQGRYIGTNYIDYPAHDGLGQGFEEQDEYRDAEVQEKLWWGFIEHQGRSNGLSSAIYPAPSGHGQVVEWSGDVAVDRQTWKQEMERWRKDYEHSRKLFTQINGMRFFTTDAGLFGLGDGSIEAGDAVCLFAGGVIVFLLREYRDGHRLVGCAYVHGIMDGELSASLDDASTRRTFRIY